MSDGKEAEKSARGGAGARRLSGTADADRLMDSVDRDKDKSRSKSRQRSKSRGRKKHSRHSKHKKNKKKRNRHSSDTRNKSRSRSRSASRRYGRRRRSRSRSRRRRTRSRSDDNRRYHSGARGYRSGDSGDSRRVEYRHRSPHDGYEKENYENRREFEVRGPKDWGEYQDVESEKEEEDQKDFLTYKERLELLNKVLRNPSDLLLLSLIQHLHTPPSLLAL